MPLTCEYIVQKTEAKLNWFCQLAFWMANRLTGQTGTNKPQDIIFLDGGGVYQLSVGGI